MYIIIYSNIIHISLHIVFCFNNLRILGSYNWHLVLMHKNKRHHLNLPKPKPNDSQSTTGWWFETKNMSQLG